MKKKYYNLRVYYPTEAGQEIAKLMLGPVERGEILAANTDGREPLDDSDRWHPRAKERESVTTMFRMDDADKEAVEKTLGSNERGELLERAAVEKLRQMLAKYKAEVGE